MYFIYISLKANLLFKITECSPTEQVQQYIFILTVSVMERMCLFDPSDTV